MLTITRSFHKKRFQASSLMVAFLLCGCGEQRTASLKVFSTEGEVISKGEPVPGVLVVLNPTDGTPAAKQGLTPSGTTDDSGRFVLSTFNPADGAPAGEYRVTLQRLEQPQQKVKGLPPEFSPPIDQFQGKYRNPANSQWIITIEKGKNVLDPIEVH